MRMYTKWSTQHSINCWKFFSKKSHQSEIYDRPQIELVNMSVLGLPLTLLFPANFFLLRHKCKQSKAKLANMRMFPALATWWRVAKHWQGQTQKRISLSLWLLLINHHCTRWPNLCCGFGSFSCLFKRPTMRKFYSVNYNSEKSTFGLKQRWKNGLRSTYNTY